MFDSVAAKPFRMKCKLSQRRCLYPHFFTSSRPTLPSYLGLSCLVLSCLACSLILSCLVLSYLVLSSPVLHLILPYLASSLASYLLFRFVRTGMCRAASTSLGWSCSDRRRSSWRVRPEHELLVSPLFRSFLLEQDGVPTLPLERSSSCA